MLKNRRDNMQGVFGGQRGSQSDYSTGWEQRTRRRGGWNGEWARLPRVLNTKPKYSLYPGAKKTQGKRLRRQEIFYSGSLNSLCVSPRSSGGFAFIGSVVKRWVPLDMAVGTFPLSLCSKVISFTFITRLAPLAISLRSQVYPVLMEDHLEGEIIWRWENLFGSCCKSPGRGSKGVH